MSSGGERYNADALVDNTTQITAKQYNKAVANARYADKNSRFHIAMKKFVFNDATRQFDGVGGISNTGFEIPLESSIYDTDRFIDQINNPRLVVPTGFQLVQLSGFFEFDPEKDWAVHIVKNSTTVMASEYNTGGNDTTQYTVQTPMLLVSSGDYFTLNIAVASTGPHDLDVKVTKGISGTLVTYNPGPNDGHLAIEAWRRCDLSGI